LADPRYDQADGLRRMFSTDRLRVVQVVAGGTGVGRLSVAVNLGLALARSGRDTLLMDVVEDGEQARALGVLGLKPRIHALGQSIIAATVSGPHGLAVLPLGLQARQTPARVAEIAGFCASLEFALVTGSSACSAQLLPIERPRREVIVVLSGAASSITEAYALIKRMSTAEVCRRYHILVNRVRSEAEALLIYRNMARVGQGYLDVELEFMGFIPADTAIESARVQGRSLLDGWPNSAAAAAFKKLVHAIARWPLPQSSRAAEEPTFAARAGVARVAQRNFS
jgi:flagellar biosynthesis protein FlhG